MTITIPPSTASYTLSAGGTTTSNAGTRGQYVNGQPIGVFIAGSNDTLVNTGTIIGGYINFSRQSAADLDHSVGRVLDHGAANAAERLPATVLAAGERPGNRPVVFRIQPTTLGHDCHLAALACDFRHQRCPLLGRPLPPPLDARQNPYVRHVTLFLELYQRPERPTLWRCRIILKTLHFPDYP